MGMKYKLVLTKQAVEDNDKDETGSYKGAGDSIIIIGMWTH